MNESVEFEACDFPDCTAPATIVRFYADGPTVARCERHSLSRLPVKHDPTFESALDVFEASVAATRAAAAGGATTDTVASHAKFANDARRRVAALYYVALAGASARAVPSRTVRPHALYEYADDSAATTCATCGVDIVASAGAHVCRR